MIRWQSYNTPGWEWWSLLWVGGPTRTPTRGCCTSLQTWSSMSQSHSLSHVHTALICLFSFVSSVHPCSALLPSLSHSIFFLRPFVRLVNVLIHLTSHSFFFHFSSAAFSLPYSISLSSSLSLSAGQVHILYFMHTITVSSWMLPRFIYNLLLAYYGVEDLCHKHNPGRDWIF